MPGTEPTARPGARALALEGLHLAVLVSFAISQPLHDALASNAEFLVARRARLSEVGTLLLLVGAGLPLALLALRAAAGRLRPSAGERLGDALRLLLVAIALLPALRRIPAVPGALLVAAAVAAGVGFVVAHRRFAAVRSFLTVLAPAPLVFAGVFLFRSDATPVLLPEPEAVPAAAARVDPVPVVVVVLDELSLPSLLDEDGAIDGVRFPHLAALAARSTWFRNASTVAVQTEKAVPALLTGRWPDDDERLPIASEQPGSLFTLLAGSHELHVFESVTSLAPADARRYDPVAAGRFGTRLGLLAEDSAVVLGHAVLPADLARALPSLRGAWSGFAEEPVRDDPLDETPEGDVRARLELFRSFTGTMRPSRRPVLHFLHVLLPHAPYKYLSSGRVYGPLSTPHFPHAKDVERWGPDEGESVSAYQRYLFQAAAVDAMVGELVAKLEAERLFDECLLVVVADHGVSFRPGDLRRRLSASNAEDILPVLLLVKEPRQRSGAVSDRNVETVDVLPTIAGVLHATLPWPVDGSPALDPEAPERPDKRIWGTRPGPPTVFPREGTALLPTTRFHRALAGIGPALDTVTLAGPHRELGGKQVATLPLVEGDAVVELDWPQLWESVDPADEFVPALASGAAEVPGGEPVHLAVGVNGTIRATGDGFRGPDGQGLFAVLLPEASLVPGRNTVEVFQAVPHGAGWALSRPRAPEAAAPREPQEPEPPPGEEGPWSIEVDGRPLELVPGLLYSSAEGRRVDGGRVLLKGWAAIPGSARIATELWVLVDGRVLFRSPQTDQRPDLGGACAGRDAPPCGFRFLLPVTSGEVRVVARTAAGSWTELRYEPDYELGPRLSLERPPDRPIALRWPDGRTVNAAPTPRGVRIDEVRPTDLGLVVSGSRTGPPRSLPVAVAAFGPDGMVASTRVALDPAPGRRPRGQLRATWGLRLPRELSDPELRGVELWAVGASAAWRLEPPRRPAPTGASR